MEFFKTRIESCRFREPAKLFAIAEPVFSDNGQVQHIDGLVNVDISRQHRGGLQPLVGKYDKIVEVDGIDSVEIGGVTDGIRTGDCGFYWIGDVQTVIVGGNNLEFCLTCDCPDSTDIEAYLTGIISIQFRTALGVLIEGIERCRTDGCRQIALRTECRSYRNPPGLAFLLRVVASLYRNLRC